ncbi:MAG: hypothetical protein QOF57_1874 [Frankiaceae bacterium]|jgi:spermidine synthase|nr:hypothetical protein [Frankiaceae bacterium]
MSARFEELDWRETPMGVISLRRRRDPVSGQDVHEVKLDDDYLMSSLFTVAEIEVARLALAGLGGTGWDVAVGGLGLGYTARAVLESADVRSLVVVEALGEVIEWHEKGLVPLGPGLTADPRCRLVCGDFLQRAVTAGIDGDRRFHAIVVDIDHSPRHLLHPSHAAFYEPAGVARLAEQLHPGGVFALWSDDAPDAAYEAVLGGVFADVRSEVVSFRNPVQEGTSTNTVYVAIMRGGG